MNEYCVPGLSSVLCLTAVLFAVVSAPAAETPRAGKIVLLPIDDRPAVAQFAQMIGAVADREVVLPPLELLGRFNRPGHTETLERWLRGCDYLDVNALVVSVDMLAYGGLVASRTHQVSTDRALKSLEFFRWFRQTHPKIPVYAFNVIMRVAPTADAANREWRDDLARWSELKDRAARTADPALKAELGDLEKKLDPSAVQDYSAARKRDLAVNLAMVELFRQKQVDTLLLLQDDARPFGLHRQDQQVIAARLRESDLAGKVQVYNGADEGSLSLVSRAVLETDRRPVRVFVVYSADKSRAVVAPYEDHPLEFTVENQIRGAGSVPVSRAGDADYTLYVNAPGTEDAEFQAFLDSMVGDLRRGRPVALADVLFPAPHQSGADERIIRRLETEDLFDRFAGYAAWNTAGNTLGTTIPQANMRVLSARTLAGDPERAARATVAHLEFLLHRFAGDYLYHDVVRLETNRRLRADERTPTDEFPPALHEQVSREVAARMKPLVASFFDRHFKGRTYAVAGKSTVRIRALKDLEIHLPWPRTFEVAIRYRMEYGLEPAPGGRN